MRVDFYHLTRSAVEQALPAIAERVLAGGSRLLILSDDSEQLDRLDGQLWTYRADSFLPHGRQGAQPILLSTDPDPAYDMIALVDGMWRDVALSYARAFHFFSEETITEARTAWRALAAHEAVERHYWKQDDAGKWGEMA